MDASFSDLGSVVLMVAHRTGSKAIDLTSGHARWEVYRKAMNSPAEWELLLEIVGLEPDPSIAISVVLQMLERVSEEDRIFWAEKVSAEDRRSVALRRVRELRVLDAVSSDAGAKYVPIADEVSEWSDWLQRRASEGSTSSKVLDQLSQFGRTRRVRNLSAERLRALRQVP